MGPQITTVQWRNNFFVQVNSGALLRVPTKLQANIKVALVPMPISLGPYNNNDTGTKTVRTCRAMIIPI